MRRHFYIQIKIIFLAAKPQLNCNMSTIAGLKCNGSNTCTDTSTIKFIPILVSLQPSLQKEMLC